MLRIYTVFLSIIISISATFSQNLKKVKKLEDGIYLVEKDGKYGISDSDGMTILKPQFDNIGKFDKKLQLAIIETNNKYGLIDITGTIICDAQFDEIRKFSNGRAFYKEKDLWGIMDETGKIVKKAQFKEVKDYKKEQAWVIIEKEWIRIDWEGNPIIEE